MKLPDPRRVVASVFPILRWSRSYDLNNAVGDLIAGVTVALTLIPQSIAYASLAGFEPQYGLYASFVGGFVYAVMGTCPQINIGPTALLSLLTFTYTNGTNSDFAVLLCFVAGIVQLIAGCLQLGFLVEFVSLPVVSGFTSAAAMTIASSQIKGLLGLKFSAESFVGTWKGVFHHIAETRLEDTLMSLVCCIVLLGMKALKDIRVKSPEDEKGRKTAQMVERALWFVGVARNAVVVVLAAVAAFLLYVDKEDPLILTGDITPGLPPLSAPPFESTVGNTTYTAGDMFSHLGSGLLVVPLVGIISNVAIAKAFARGRTLDATQEIVALGACNLAGAFVRSFPVNGSFTRSAVSDASGVRTPAAGFYTGIIVILTLLLLTPYFYFIPRAALAAVIICAVLHMVDIDIVKKLWATSRLDLIPLFGTVVCCLLLGIEVGLICGVGIDVVLLLYYHSRPPLDVRYVNDGTAPAHYAIHPVGGLHFAGAERVRSKLIALQNPNKVNPQPHSPHVIALETLRVIPDEVRTAENGSNVLRNDAQNYAGNTENDTNGLGSGIRALQHDASYIENGTNNVTINGSNASQNDASNTENGADELENGTNNLPNVPSNVTDSNPNNMGNAVNNNVSSNGIVPNRSSERRTLDVLVVHCDSWYRMDYTFLQSLKMLVSEWSRHGVIVWCDAKPTVKWQLDTVLHDPVYCSSAELRIILTSLSVIEEPSGQLTSDTQL